MKTAKIMGALGLTLITGACSPAGASQMDPTNPLHCLAIFEAYLGAAKMQNDARLARGLDARAEGYAIQASRLPKAERTPEVLAEIEQQLLKLEDGGLALSSECLKRQDAEIEASRGNH